MKLPSLGRCMKLPSLASPPPRTFEGLWAAREVEDSEGSSMERFGLRGGMGSSWRDNVLPYLSNKKHLSKQNIFAAQVKSVTGRNFPVTVLNSIKSSTIVLNYQQSLLNEYHPHPNYINIQMITKAVLILFLSLFSLTHCETTIQFQIRKRHPKWSNSVPLGKLSVRIQGRSIDSEVEPYHNDFLTEHDFEDDNPIILEFAATKSNAKEYQDRVFVTAVDQINSDPHGQKIAIVAGSDPQHLAITAINYVQTRDRVGQIYTEALFPREELSPMFGYVAAPPKNQQQEESFFSRYKWPLIIGGVLLFTMSSQAPEQPQQGAAPRT